MKICSIDAVPVSLHVRPDLAIVSAAGSHPQSNYLFIKIVTDEGVTGWGEATLAHVWSGESQAAAQHVICDILSPLLLGKDPLQLTDIADSMDRFLIGNPFTKAGIEMALIDLAAKIHHVPVYVWLGGA